MDTATQLHGERSADLHDAHLGAVVLAEQSHGAHRLGLLQGGLDGVHLVVAIHGAVGDLLNLVQLVLGQLLAVVEVEAQVARLVHGARLDGCRPQHLAQGGVDQVRAGVRLACLVAPRLVHRGLHLLPHGQLAATDGHVVYPDLLADLLHVLHSGSARGGGHLAAIGHLAAGLGVERGAVQDHLGGSALRSGLHERAVTDNAQHGSLVG